MFSALSAALRLTATLALVAGALAIGTLPGAAHPHDAPKSELVLVVEREVLATRDLIAKAAQAKDVAALQKLIAEEFSHTHGSGKVDGRDARIVALLGGEPTIELASVSVSDSHVHVHGGTTAIVTGRSPILNRSENRTHEFRWMQVYVKGTGGWRLVASQATRLPPAPTN